MKKWLMFLLLMGGTTVCFAQYGSSSGQNYNPYQSGGSASSYGQQQQQMQSGSPCESLKNKDPEAYAFAKQLSPIHQTVFCKHFSRIQQKQAMALAGSPTQGLKGEAGSISPDMAVEVIMQTARDAQNQSDTQQQQAIPYSNQPQQSYPSQGQNSSRSGRYSNY